MSEELDRLCAAHLDRSIDAADRARLEALLATDPRAAQAFARAALLHDAIAREMVAGEVGRDAARAAEGAGGAGDAGDAPVASLARIPTVASAGRRAAMAAALLLALGGLLWIVLPAPSAAAAETELARLLAARAQTRRVYRIEVTEPGEAASPETKERADGRPARARPPIDGALLSLGAPGCYVLERHGPGDERTITGSDGATSWSVPERGAVRTSGNPARFRGGLPGEQHGLPFVDPSEDLAQLRRTCDLTLGADGSVDGRPTRTLVARRRADAARGPREFALEYDAQTALVLRMRFSGLPQANGGPRAVELRLVDEQPIDPGYFRHESHHDRDRKVVAEE